MDIKARQLEGIDFNYLNQAETYQYSIDQLARVKASEAIMAKLSNEVTAWEKAVQAFDTAYRKTTTAGQTKVVETLDVERDSLYTGFTGTVSNALKSPIEGQQQAAQQLQEPLKRYAVSAGAEYQEQTMRTDQLCHDLLTNFSAQLDALGLKAWVEALNAKNQAFHDAMVQRTNEQASYVKSELSNLRIQIMATYRVFVRLLNVILIYEGDTAYATVVDQLNAEIRHYKQIIARKGGGSATSQSANGNGTPSGHDQTSDSDQRTDDSSTPADGGGSTGGGSSEGGSGTGGSGTGGNSGGGSTGDDDDEDGPNIGPTD